MKWQDILRECVEKAKNPPAEFHVDDVFDWPDPYSHISQEDIERFLGELRSGGYLNE